MNSLAEISGVVIKKLVVHKDLPDDPSQQAKRGFLMEVVRSSDGLLKKFAQSTMTVAYKGAVKAFHWHKSQDDVWLCATGKAKIVLYDRRENSKTQGMTQELTAGEGDYKVILIPRGVAHGYKVVSKKPVILFYHTTREYNPKNPDEQRIPFDDKTIGYKW